MCCILGPQCTTSERSRVSPNYFGRCLAVLAACGCMLQITESGDLVIRDVSWSKNMGLYKCHAHNVYGSDHSDTFLYPVSQPHSPLQYIIACHDMHLRLC